LSCDSGFGDCNGAPSDGCETAASAETCDGLDNDCDGVVDNGHWVWEEVFATPPDYSYAWTISGSNGTTTITYTVGNLRIQAGNTAAGTGVALSTQATCTGSKYDLTTEMYHGGWGRSGFSLGTPDGVTPAWFQAVVLDTDDTNFLEFSGNTPAGYITTGYEFAGTPYMNRWISVRVVVDSATASYFVDGVLLKTFSIIRSDQPLAITISAGSISWKSGSNDTSFRRVRLETWP